MTTNQAVFASESNHDSRMKTNQAVFASEEDVHGADHAIAKDERKTQANEGDVLFVNGILVRQQGQGYLENYGDEDGKDVPIKKLPSW